MIDESTLLINGHEPVTKQTVEDAINEFRKPTKTKSVGKLVVLNYQNININHDPSMGFWDLVDGSLIKVAFDESDPDKDRCRHFARAILSGDEIIGTTPSGYPIIGEKIYENGRGYV